MGEQQAALKAAGQGRRWAGQGMPAARRGPHHARPLAQVWHLGAEGAIALEAVLALCGTRAVHERYMSGARSGAMSGIQGAEHGAVHEAGITCRGAGEAQRGAAPAPGPHSSPLQLAPHVAATHRTSTATDTAATDRPCHPTQPLRRRPGIPARTCVCQRAVARRAARDVEGVGGGVEAGGVAAAAGHGVLSTQQAGIRLGHQPLLIVGRSGVGVAVLRSGKGWEVGWLAGCQAGAAGGEERGGQRRAGEGGRSGCGPAPTNPSPLQAAGQPARRGRRRSAARVPQHACPCRMHPPHCMHMATEPAPAPPAPRCTHSTRRPPARPAGPQPPTAPGTHSSSRPAHPPVSLQQVFDVNHEHLGGGGAAAGEPALRARLAAHARLAVHQEHVAASLGVHPAAVQGSRGCRVEGWSEGWQGGREGRVAAGKETGRHPAAAPCPPSRRT